MKRTYLAHALAALAALMMTSCASDSELREQWTEEFRLTGEIAQTPLTRTQIDIEPTENGSLGILWSVGDEIGVFGNSTANARFKGTFTTAVSLGLFSGDMNSGDNPKFAYYPYVDGAADAKSIPVTIASVQTYTDETSIAAGDIKASDSPIQASDGSYRFIFKPMVSILKVKVAFNGLEGVGTDEKLKAIVIKSENPERVWAGDFTMDLTNLSAGLTPQAEKTYSSLKVNLTDGNGDGKNVTRDIVAYASIAPGIRKGDGIEIQLQTDRHTVKFNVTALQDFKAGACYDVPLDLDNLKPENNLQIIDPAADSPELTSFSFKVADNSGKILANEAYYEEGSTETTLHAVTEKTLGIDQTTGSVEGFIPYLYDFKLIPSFTTSKGAVVTVNGQVQTSGESEVDFSSSEPVTYTVSNGLETKEYKVSITNTGLPVVVLDIDQNIVTKDEKFGRFLDYLDLTAKTGAFPTTDKIAIYEGKGQVSLSMMDCGIRLRGNSSKEMPKKPVNIKLSDKVKVLGMNKHKRWCLIASEFDKTMMRNAFTYSLANEVQDHFTGEVGTELGKGLIYNPHGKPVEVVMNGLHVGTYFLCEHIKQGKQRLAIMDSYDDVLESGTTPTMENCGFLMEMSTDEEVKNFYTSNRRLPVTVKDADNIAGTDLLNKLKTYFDTFESYIYSGYNARNTAQARGYYDKAYEMIDINSMIDWWIINELAMNDEMQWPKSVFLYKNGTGKVFAGPVWDFDYQTYVNIEKFNSSSLIRQMENHYGWEPFPYKFTTNGYESLVFKRGESTGNPYVWYPYLFKDPVFVARVKVRWNSLYNSVLQNQSAVIAQMGKEREKAAESNWKIWNIEYFHAGNCGDEYDFTYPEAIENFNYVFEKRREGLNSAINSL